MVKPLPRPRAIAVLIGAPGSGKTKTGKRVAKALGLDFIDTDRVIVAEHGPIAEIFEREGEAAFRAYERTAVARALRKRAVVSLGGGAVLDAATQHDLRDLPVVLLTVTRDGIEERLAAEPDAVTKRPLLRDGGIAAWERLVEARGPLYERLATASFDTSHRPFEAIAEEVAAWLRQREQEAPITADADPEAMG